MNVYAKNVSPDKVPFKIYLSNEELNWNNLESAAETIVLENENDKSWSTSKYSVLKTFTPAGQYSYIAIAIKDNSTNGEGYLNELTFNWEKTRVGDPTFSIAPNSDVESGTVVKVIKPADATGLWVKLNGGDFIEVDESEAEIPITEDTLIEAYATDEELVSNQTSAFYSVEETGDNIDAINPFIFHPEGNWASYADQAHQGTCASGKSYTFHGVYKDHESAALVDGKQPGVFNFTSPSHFLTNGTGTRSGESQDLYCLKVDGAKGGKTTGTVYVAFSDEPFTAAPDLASATYVTVSNDPAVTADYNFSQLISVKKAFENKGIDKESAKYFAVSPGNGTGMEVPRVVATYSNILTGVDKIETEAANGAEEIFSVNGYRVNGTDLAPGLYIRKHNGKTEKFVVK